MAIVGQPSVFFRLACFNTWRSGVSNLTSYNVRARNHHHEAPTSENNKDVVIVGGGMVGTALAVALAKNRCFEGKKIVLVEGSGKLKYVQKENYSNRVVALNKQTRTLLSSIGVWKHIDAARFTPVRKMQVWDATSDAMITFNEDYLADEIAYIVENDILLHALDQELEDKSNLNVIYNAKVEDICLPSQRGENAKVKLQSGEELSAKLLVGADGANSRVRQAMGIQYISWDYEQMGIVATLKLSEATTNVVAWQRFLPTGPIALLPLSENQSSLVWSLPSNKAKELLKEPAEAFVDAINDALWKVYPKNSVVEGGMTALQQLLNRLSLQAGHSHQLPPSVTEIVEGSRAAFPLAFGHAVNYTTHGVVLVGDAAHRVHPLAGQGVNLGFGDVTALVKILDDAVRNGTFIGDISHLARYETLRQRHNLPTMMVIDTLHRLYKGTAAPVVLARGLGLQLLNSLAPLKRCMVDYASEVPVSQ
ncbi:ubiquinone biosynthesis monooxygenase COQ6, mitochondrial [Diachasmimorpha longicaudata]|uniref:ubiquinone biosynthesis monooxygenase COQ6, mitochondrial n=1 Tax=Diachasmimorpha longicaudata TaxID=58733 RepID=UPI0030B87789